MGILMFIVRIAFDPYLIYVIRKDLKLGTDKTKKGNLEPLCSFTNSAMNIELVYIIL